MTVLPPEAAVFADYPSTFPLLYCADHDEPVAVYDITELAQHLKEAHQ